jgi:hemolysin activation/secretion protein
LPGEIGQIKRVDNQMSQKKLLPLVLLALSPCTFAAEVPSAGSQLQQVPAAPAPQKAAPQFQVEQGAKPVVASGDETRIAVNSLHVSNAQAFSEAELITASGFTPSGELSLSALRGLAAKIADYYHSHGYFLAQAMLPAQDIKDGAVTIAVVEGQYGKVTLRNQSNLSDGLAHRLLDGLNSGDTITIAPLESRLLQLSDLPGVNVKSTLVPGASVGASDLIVDVTPGRRVSGSIDADNSGSRYTGEYRTGATLNINNPLGRGDVATLRAFTSWDGLNYGRAAYQLQFGKADAGVAYTALDYDLGREFDSLKAHGTAQIASVYSRYPLLRSRNNNLFAQVNVDAKKFRDKLDVTAPATVTDKKADVAMLSLVGDHRDRFGGGGLSTYSLTWSSGSLDLESPEALSVDATTAHSNGHYDKLGLNVMRLQSVTESLSLYAALQGQLASQNLDVSEKMGLGGANAVRAYPEGEAYVDQGYLVNLEARLSLPRFSELMSGQVQLVGFVDSGTGRLSKDPWDEGRNHRTLSGGGLGVNWLTPSSFVVKAYYAHTIGAAAATSAPDKDGRFWINAIKYF